jgi:hypothetical protein
MSTGVGAEIPRWRCHKEVHAAKIAALETREDGSAVIAPVGGGYTIHARPGWRERFKGSEQDTGYYVLYDDGFESWSPSKAFEEGYTRI